ncbi:MAG: SMC family ATPase, partial [Actinomycetota bacterium]|nr:SMC family ATPase [Actinomycetota bacterium]
MKPVSLTVRGFRSHESETELSFAGRRLFAIVGPTGAGKSSILDAVAYSLYGATPRIRRNVKKLICSRSESAHVRFVFELEGHEYEITRSLRRSGTGEHVLVDGSSGARVIGEGKVNEKVVGLLGLDFEAFCSSVLLAQGKFSEFLEASPTERSKILKGVFRLDQIDALREAAKARRIELDGEVKRVEGRRAHIPADVEERLERAVAAHHSCSQRVAVLEKALPQERKLLDAVERSAEDLAAAEAALASARGARDAAPAAEVIRELAAQEERVAEPLAAATDAVESAVAARDAARARLEDLEEGVGAYAELVEARVKAEVLAQGATLIDTYSTAVALAEKAHESALADLDEAEAFEQQALESLEKIRAEREELERAHQAHVLRDTLAVGEPCPVCEQSIAVIPRGPRPAALAGNRKAESDAQAAHDRAAKAARKAATAAATAESDLVAARRRLADEEEKVAASRSGLSELLGAVEDPLAEVERRLGLLSEAREEISSAGEELERARGELAKWTEARAQVTAIANKVVAQLSHAAGALSLPPPPHDAAVADLVDEATKLLDAAATAVEAAEAKAEKARAAEEDALGALAALRESVGLRATESVEAAVKDAIRTATEAAGEEKSLRAMVEEAAVLDDQEKQLKATLAL